MSRSLRHGIGRDLYLDLLQQLGDSGSRLCVSRTAVMGSPAVSCSSRTSMVSITIGSEPGDLAKGVEGTAMRIAVQVVEIFELSENGEIDVRPEGTFQIGPGSDFFMEQQPQKRLN